MKLPKITNNFKTFVEKYETGILIFGIISAVVALFLLPFNPKDYLFPLAGLFYECPWVLTALLSIGFCLANLQVKKLWSHKYKTIAIIEYILLGFLLFNGILSFVHPFSFVTHTIISLYIYGTFLLIKSVFYKNITLADTLSDIGLTVSIFYMAMIFKLLTLHEAANSILIMTAAIVLYFSVYSITTYVLVRRAKKYIKKSEMNNIIEEDEVDLGMRELQNKLKGESPTVISEDE
jgi:hypothetical protein